jgi:SEC-C motif
MATETQISANRQNAQASTGPKTEEGKARTAANGITLGLFTVRDLVRPDEQEEYAALCRTLKEELQPTGIIEETLVTEILHAAWRLQRCAKVEESLFNCLSAPLYGGHSMDPMEDHATTPTQLAVDRARAQTHRSLLRLLGELRRIQTERQIRNQSRHPGLASWKEVQNARMLSRKMDGLDNLEAIIAKATAPPVASRGEITNQTQSPAPIPRSAACPCGSGAKYKRCCGVNAPAVLTHSIFSQAA